MKKYQVAIIGSTANTVQCAQALLASESFNIPWILTPSAKPKGRKQTITPNPLDLFAQEQQLETIYLKNKIDQTTQQKIKQAPPVDFLLVVDFGYLIPTWLLSLPKLAPLNIHPSALPKWRGSSPGQFALLFNEVESAVTLMIMNDQLDQGDIITQDYFVINQAWTQQEYYQHAFSLIAHHLPQDIKQFAKTKASTPQATNSPTMMARRIAKEDAFVTWAVVKQAMTGETVTKLSSTLLQQALTYNHSISLTLERASKAFFSWPGLWTVVPTKKGDKRMKLIDLSDRENILVLETVQLEGKTKTQWNNVKNLII